MTQKQFDKCVQSKIPIYKIWIKNTFHKEKTPYERVPTYIDWINKDIVYDCNLHCHCMYASEDKLDKCIDKLFNYIAKQEKQKIAEATKKLECIKRARKEIK